MWLGRHHIFKWPRRDETQYVSSQRFQIYERVPHVPINGHNK